MATCKIVNHTVSPTASYIFDTNIWVYIFAPIAQSNKYKQRVYSRLLSDILSRQATIWINSLILSEYVNVMLKLAFKQWMSNNNLLNANFKRDFRPQKEYRDALSDVKCQVLSILGLCERRPDDFNRIDINGIIDSIGIVSYDYGDAILVDVCKCHREINLVTDDSDITCTDLPFTVITA